MEFDEGKWRGFAPPGKFSAAAHLSTFMLCVYCSAGELGVVAVEVGQSVTLKCRSTSEFVDWWYQRSVNSLAQQICSAGVKVNGFEADGRYSLTNISLVIKNVTEQESGIYRCRETGQGDLRILYLNVSGKYTNHCYLCHYTCRCRR